MNKKLILLLSTSVICLASCSEAETERKGTSKESVGLNNASIAGESEIVGTRWANTITSPIGSCSDSLYFFNSSEVVLYDCELGWHFNAHYTTSGDSINISIIEAQFEVDSYKELEPSSIWKLMKNEDHLAVASIMLLRSDKWEEVPAENYKRIGDFKKVIR
jgi:hypothetical protein